MEMMLLGKLMDVFNVLRNALMSGLDILIFGIWIYGYIDVLIDWWMDWMGLCTENERGFSRGRRRTRRACVSIY